MASFEARQMKLRGYFTRNYSPSKLVLTTWIVEEAPRLHQAFVSYDGWAVTIPMPWLYYAVQLTSPTTKGYGAPGALKVIAVGGSPKQLKKIDDKLCGLPLPNMSDYSPCHKAIEVSAETYKTIDLSKDNFNKTLKRLSTDAIVNWWGQSFNGDLSHEEQPLYQEICTLTQGKKGKKVEPVQKSYCGCGCGDYDYNDYYAYDLDYDDFLVALSTIELKDLLKLPWPKTWDMTSILCNKENKAELTKTSKDPKLLAW